jgi:hypothetical protein
MQIIVRDNNVEQALRALKKKLQREGVYRGLPSSPPLQLGSHSPGTGRGRSVANAPPAVLKCARSKRVKEPSSNPSTVS